MNTMDYPIGDIVENWQEPPAPNNLELQGRHITLIPLNPEHHVEDLWHAYALDTDHVGWRYLFHGPFDHISDLQRWLESSANKADPYFFSVLDKASGKAIGVASYLRIAPKDGSIEVGNIHFSPLLQRTPCSTEAMYLMMQWAFEAGYRRYEWKCNALNMPSRRAAQRLGFSYEGIFRQATISKGRNRDTAWFAIIEKEWPALQSAFQQWLSAENFDEEGLQRQPLRVLTQPLLYQFDPSLTKHPPS